jgi:hypothetical protein
VKPPKEGDYVLATKYSDGSPYDQWYVGFYKGLTGTDPPYDPIRHDVVDGEGKLVRLNGFRRVKKISQERGRFIIDSTKAIAINDRSLWWWVRCSMKPVLKEEHK